MNKIKPWIIALRLRSLALSVSSVITGSFLAYQQGGLNINVLIGTLLVTVFLQTLSNLANEYGDTIHGVDNDARLGPKRGVQAGDISLQQMKTAIILVVALSLIAGIWLVIEGTKGLSSNALWILLATGILAILAALKYTIGKKPYGYLGLGDIFVFIFFGLVAVLGTYFLHTHQLPAIEFLPAASMGLFSVGVLNMNNLRDYQNDLAHGKRSMMVMLGVENGKKYHAIVVLSGLVLAILFTILQYRSLYQFLFLLSAPFFIKNVLTVFRTRQLSDLDIELKRLSIATLLFSLTFGIGLLL
jgi:1,4-dihydroxy-2-naphthoate octaprenyltransferase